MAWIESHQTLSKHRKTLRATAILRCDRHKLIGHLHQLWWWALDNVPANGHLGDLTDFEIAAGAEWDGDPETFVAALIQAGFVDEREDGRYLHDWTEHGGRFQEQRQRDAERKRRARHSGQSEDVRRTSGGQGTDVHGKSGVTQHNTTQQDQGDYEEDPDGSSCAAERRPDGLPSDEKPLTEMQAIMADTVDPLLETLGLSREQGKDAYARVGKLRGRLLKMRGADKAIVDEALRRAADKAVAQLEAGELAENLKSGETLDPPGRLKAALNYMDTVASGYVTDMLKRGRDSPVRPSQGRVFDLRRYKTPGE